MANKQTRSLAKTGKSLKFNKGVDFTGADHPGNPEIAFVERPCVTGVNVNSSAERAARKKKRYEAPTIAKSKGKSGKPRRS